VKTDESCRRVRSELSALLDGELDSDSARAVRGHVAECSSCRLHARRLASVRSSLRLGEAEGVPDLTDDIMVRVAAERGGATARTRVMSLARTFSVAAAAAALVIVGASLPSSNRRGDVASAADIIREVRNAARALETYHATFRITERGWHPDVARREFRAQVWFAASERFRLEIDDLTAYPDPEQWPENSVAFVASPRRVRVREPSRCPVALLPGCVSGAPEVRTLTGRAPFDGRVVLPTDIVVPLGTLGGAGRFEVEQSGVLAGRPAQLVSLEMRSAVPLVSSLQPGGSWRAFHPGDEVRLWLDRDTWFPLGFDVIAADSIDRERWAAARGYDDRGGDVLLRVRAVRFDEPGSFRPGFFGVGRGGLVTSGGFRTMRLGPRWPAPADVGDLLPYRSGRTQHAAIRSYASGTTWLRVTLTRARPSTQGAAALDAEEVRLPGGGFGYYTPAGTELRREVDVFSRRVAAHIEGNLGRADLLEVAASFDFTGRRLPRAIHAPGGIRIARLGPDAAFDEAEFAVRPARLPPGYAPGAPDVALLVRSLRDAPTLVLHYRGAEAEYDGVGIRITQSLAERLPPTSGAPSAVDIGTAGRYFAERGELEWVKDGILHSILAPSFDLSTLLDIARGMR
jgi:hypothetical protein